MIKWLAEVFGGGAGEAVPDPHEIKIDAAEQCRQASLRRHAEAAAVLERRLGIRGVDQAFDEVGRG